MFKYRLFGFRTNNFIPVFDDPPPAPEGEEKPSDPPKEDKSVPQDKVNQLLADQKRKIEQRYANTIKELETLRENSKLTIQEKESLSQQIEELRAATMTAEEKAKREKEKLQKEADSKISLLEAERNTWRDRYTDASITRSISDAAVTEKAISTEQIIALLRPNTRLVENTDEDNKPNGTYTPKVKFADVSADGKDVTLELTVPEAVKRMKELNDRYGNLFHSDKAGGTGGSNVSGKIGKLDIKNMTPAQYREHRSKFKS